MHGIAIVLLIWLGERRQSDNDNDDNQDTDELGGKTKPLALAKSIEHDDNNLAPPVGMKVRWVVRRERCSKQAPLLS